MPELIIKLGDTVVQRYSIEKDVVSIGRHAIETHRNYDSRTAPTLAAEQA